MKVSLNWLREFVELPATVPELTELLTLAGVEVEGIARRGVDIPRVVVAQILESAPHPNADRLSVCKVDAGTGEPAQIVCGAKNYRVGDKVPLALPGAVLPGDFTIKVGKLRGVESQGMMCSAKELGLGEGHEGLLILPAEARVGAPLSELFPADVVLDLEITPNRPDLLSHFGIAREIAALRHASPPSSPGTPDPLAHLPGRIAIEAPDLCAFYSARRIRGVQVGPSPAWLRERLETIGLRAINNIVDITNFVMMELGQPLHAFDEKKVKGGEICVRRAGADEKFVALDGKTYELRADDLVIADTEVAIALAGVMGGEHSGVTAGTSDIVLESALFAPAAVRRTSRRLGLVSDASYRFERGVDPAQILPALERAAQLIMQVAGGTPEPVIEGAGEIPVEPRSVLLRVGRVSALLGVEVPAARLEEILTHFGLRKEGAETWRIPSHRSDLAREADLIEEIVRAYGIENIPGTISGRPAPASSADAAHDAQMEIRRRLAGYGFHEARSFSLIGEKATCEEGVLRVRNPLLEDQVLLRPALVPGLLAALERNVRGGARAIRLFEIGRVFRPDGERTHLAAVLTGAVQPASWRNPETRAADLFDLKGLLEALGFEDLAFENVTRKGLLPAQEIRLRGRAAGVLGQLPPAKLRELDLQAQPVALFEIELGALRGIPRKIAPIPKFPAVTRDIAMIVAESVTHAQIEEVLRGGGEPLLARIELFDLFADPDGVRVPRGQKSLAYSLTYRSAERTLTADEVNAAHARLKEQLKAALPVSFRE